MSELIKGRIYKIDGRNLSYGVWDGKDSFIGLRRKWGSQFLDSEMHYDADDHFGTVRAAEDIGVDVDEAILERRIPGLFAVLDEIEYRERERLKVYLLMADDDGTTFSRAKPIGVAVTDLAEANKFYKRAWSFDHDVVPIEVFDTIDDALAHLRGRR